MLIALIKCGKKQCYTQCNKELRSIGVRTGVGHAQQSWFTVVQHKRLVIKLFAIDGKTATPILAGDVATLKWKN